MIRALIIIAVAGFLMAVGCISAAVAIGGPEAIARSNWSWGWVWDDEDHPRADRWRHETRGPQIQRDFPWSGSSLSVDAPAEIEYVQAPGPAKLTIRGPAALLDRVRVEGGRISLAPGRRRGSGLHIRLTAPDVTRFELDGVGSLNIAGYKQDQLVLDASGLAEIHAEGETKAVKVRVSGAGEADLAQLKTAGADVDISGAGEATVGPTDWARVAISGAGEVELLTRPAQLETSVTGAGSVHVPGDDGGRDQVDRDREGRGPARST